MAVVDQDENLILAMTIRGLMTADSESKDGLWAKKKVFSMKS